MIIILIITIMLMMIVIILKIIIILIVTIMLIMIVLILKIIMIIIIILIITIIGFSSGHCTQWLFSTCPLFPDQFGSWKLVFLWGRQNRRTRRKPRSKVENQHVTQPTCDVRSRN